MNEKDQLKFEEFQEGKCIIFSAPSGAGKTTIVRYLLRNIDQLGSPYQQQVDSPGDEKKMVLIIIFLVLKNSNEKLKTMNLLNGKKCTPIISMAR